MMVHMQRLIPLEILNVWIVNHSVKIVPKTNVCYAKMDII